MERLTWRQEEILEFIRATICTRGRPPTVREIAGHFKIRSPHGAHGHLRALERKGYIERDANTARAIRIKGQSRLRGVLPVAGEIHAGRPQEAVEQSALFDFHDFFGDPESLSAALVLDDSLASRQIAAGDYLILRQGAIVGMVRTNVRSHVAHY